MSINASEKSFLAEERYCNFYAGGNVAWSLDGTHFYCQNSNEVTDVEVTTGQVVRTFSVNENATDNRQTEDEDEDSIYSFALSPNNQLLVTAHRSGLLRLWSLESGKITKTWKAQHKGPIVNVVFSPCRKLVCSSGGDSTLRIWDYINGSCLGVLREFKGPALLLRFHPSEEKTEIFASGTDSIIYCWDYSTKTLLYQLRGHFSQVTDISFENDSADCEYLASVSRDKVLIIWNLKNGTQYKVIPLYEELEGVFFKNNDSTTETVMVACTNGHLKIVDYKIAKITPIIDCEAAYEIKALLHCKQTQQIAVVTTEHNIIVYKLEAKGTNLECVKQLIGYNDEILDLCFLGEQDRFLAMATNSKNLKIYDTAENMNCKLITGHTDIVMAISSIPNSNFLLSAGKDLNIILWELDSTAFTFNCLVKNANSHTSNIGSISFGHNMTKMFASVCQDGSLKVWNIKQQKNKESSFIIKFSAIAHEKEVNCVTFSPNNKIIATASQDKTAKLWNSDTQSLISTLRGHTRGVWFVRFSPVDQVVLTASSDCSLRVWSLGNFNCLKRFEQECTVLRAEFIDHGKYILSSSTDGVIKVWNIKTNECVRSLDEHTDRVWSLAVSGRSKKYFYSGGADSKLVKWRETTEEDRKIEIAKKQEEAEQDQLLQNLLHENKNLKKAFKLALNLGKPKTTYNIINEYVRLRQTEELRQVVVDLNDDQRALLLENVKAWITNTKFCRIANLVLHFILGDVLANPTKQSYKTRHMVEVLKPYVQRHFNRVNELKKDITFLEFLIQCM